MYCLLVLCRLKENKNKRCNTPKIILFIKCGKFNYLGSILKAEKMNKEIAERIS
jgi:hypothetical protein